MATIQKKPDFSRFTEDELDAAVTVAAAADPTLKAALADAHNLQALIDELVSQRKRSGLTQTNVAESMGVRQPTVSQFETESSDPRLSTVQRYARALGARIVWRMVFDGECRYAPSTDYTERRHPSVRPSTVTVRRKPLPRDWAAQYLPDQFERTA